MAANDAKAPILEVLVSQHHSEYSSLTPDTPRIVNKHPPTYPLVRAVSNSKAEGSKHPDGTAIIRVPTSRETEIHFLESAWLSIPVTPGYDPSGDISSGISPSIFRAFRKIELLTEDNILLETLTPLDIDIWERTAEKGEQYDILRSIAYGNTTSSDVQLKIPFCILKDNAPFPLVSMSSTRFLVRITYSPASLIDSNLNIGGTEMWFQGMTLPPSQISSLETMNWTLPITTFTNQTRVYEKGSAKTLESFLLEDTRDLRSLVFVMGDIDKTTTSLERYKGEFYGDPTASDVYNALKEGWLDIGSDPVSRPVRKEMLRIGTRIGRCNRIQRSGIGGVGEDGLHILPISNSYLASRFKYSAPGAMTRISSKISLRLRFNPIERNPGDRDRFEISVVTQRGQRLRIKDGLIDSIDSFHGDEKGVSNPRVSDREDNVAPAKYGSPGDSKEGIPEDVLGYITKTLTHEPFSRSTRSVALKGSHRFGETIVGELPLTADLVGNLVLRLRLPELPSGYRWINGVGYYILDRVVIRHEDIILHDCPGEGLFMLHQQDDDLAVRSRRDANNLGYRSFNTLGLSPPVTGSPDGRLYIQIPWSFGSNGFAPLPTAALRDRRLRLEITLNDVEKLIVPDSVDVYNPGDISCILSGEKPDLLPRGVDGGLTVTETVVDIVGYTIPASMREELLEKPRLMMIRQLRLFKFDDPEGILRVIPVNHGVNRLIFVSPRNSEDVGGEREYLETQLNQIYAGSTHWYTRIPPENFIKDWSRLTQNTGNPDVNIQCIDFTPGFINTSRFQELRLQTTPGRLMVLSESIEPFRIQKGKIGPLFSD